jgi:hypothetical protein
MEVSVMNNHRIVTLVGAVLLSAFCLVPSPRAQDANGVMMHDGEMMMMKDGKATTPMEHSMTMSNGTTVMNDGTVTMKDGTKTHMKEGQMMMMDGHIMEGGHSGMMEGGSTGGMSH